jgi:membrane protease YdiL (CAAX protease family)
MKRAATSEAIPLVADVAIFAIGTLLQFAVVFAVVPQLADRGWDPLAAWMLVSVPLIFVPIAGLGYLLLRSEAPAEPLARRLWLTRPTAADLRFALCAWLALAAGSALCFSLCAALGLASTPPFARGAAAWTGDRLWLLGLWLGYWPINILGENFVWRAVCLPRMEARFGAGAFALNALLWGAFHLAFGLGNLIVLVPALVAVPYVAQRRRNNWLAAMLHAGLSAPGFAALAFGKV